MPEAIYILCSLLSAWCAYLLFRQRRDGGSQLILWTAIAFAGLALNNALLVVDLVVLPRADIILWRTAVALAAMGALVFGFVWESH